MNPSEIYKALSNPVRREMLEWLKEPGRHFCGDGVHVNEHGVCAGGFERCGLSQSTVSAHLACLQRAGLVTSERVGQWVYFRRNEETIAAFLKSIHETL